jgi:uncharacterized OsmC-like protein
MSDRALSTYELTGTRTSPHRMAVDTDDATFEVGRDANPIEYLLGSLLGCVNSTASAVARDMDIEIDELEATVSGGVNYAAYKGEETDDRAGIQGIDVTLSVVADADEARLQEWLAAVERRCPVTDNVANETPIDLDLEV